MTDVMYFVGSFAVGGTERHLSQVLPALAARGWSVEATVLVAGGAFTAPITAAGIPIGILPRGYTVPVPKVRGSLALAQQTWSLASRLRRNPPRILHCFLPTCCEIGALASSLSGFSPVVMSRRSQASRPSLFPGDKALERWALRNAALVFGHSRFVVDELRAEGVEPDQLRLNHNGIDLAAFDAAAGDRALTRQQEGWREHEFVFATVANLIPYKGHEDLLRAFAKLQDHNRSWRLVLVGRGEPAFTARLVELAGELGISERVEFKGLRSDVASLLTAADAGILASHQEGFPNAILEYMAAGLPVIATATGGNFDAVAEGETGLLVPPASAGALSVAANTLLSDRHLVETFGRAARRRVERLFSLDACVDRYEQAYRHLLGHQDQ